MSFTFNANNKNYTYQNVGQRNGFVAELGKGNLNWANIKPSIVANKKVNRALSNRLRDQCLNAIKNSNDLPYDTGNLLQSIRSKNTPTGFELYINEDQAPYQYFLEFGTKKSKKHKGFWYEKMFNVVVLKIIKETKGDVQK